MDTEKLMRRASGRKLFTPSYMRDAPAPPVIVKVAEMMDGTTVLLHENGTTRIWELDFEKLNQSRIEWRRMLGMEEADGDGNVMEIRRFDEDGNPIGEGDGEGGEGGDGEGEGEGEGSGKGEGEGEGEGKGSGGEGEGSGGTSGTRGGQEIGRQARNSRAERVALMEDDAKKEISEEAELAAKEMAAQALDKRLADIDMNEMEFEAYDSVLESVSKEIVQLRLVLDAAESRQQEREWQKFQLDGCVFLTRFSRVDAFFEILKRMDLIASLTTRAWLTVSRVSVTSIASVASSSRTSAPRSACRSACGSSSTSPGRCTASTARMGASTAPSRP